MERHYAAGDIIVRREEIVPYLIRIETGRVRFEMGGQVWSLGDGDCFGEEGIFLGKPAPYTALASEETTVTLLSEAEAEAFLATNPVAALRAVLRTTARLHEGVASLSVENPHYVHLLKTLLPYAPREADPSSFTRLSLDGVALAEMMGVGEETVRRLLTEAAVLDDVRIGEDGMILVKGAEYLRRRIVEGRSAAFFAEAPRKPYGRGRYNLLSRIT